MIARTLEPEVMDSAVEASDYDAMDFVEVNRAFCDDFMIARELTGRTVTRVLDVGCGTARIPVTLTTLAHDLHVTGIDLAEHMLAIGRAHVAAAGLDARIELAIRDAKATGFDPGAFDAVVSNTVLHHLAEPEAMLREMWRVLPAGGLLFLRDLVRPDDLATLDDHVARYAVVPPGLDATSRARYVRQRDLFAASLHAALSLAEVAAMLGGLGIPAGMLRMTSDRHFTLAAVKR